MELNNDLPMGRAIMSEDVVRCDTCKFLEKDVCKRYPPTVYHGSRDSINPPVYDSDWCGEWKPSKRYQELNKKLSVEVSGEVSFIEISHEKREEIIKKSKESVISL